MIGLDHSINLLKIAQQAGGKTREVVLGNVLSCCWRKHAFVREQSSKEKLRVSEGIQDYAISIATIHHLATPRRRMLAVQVSTKFSVSIDIATQAMKFTASPAKCVSRAWSSSYLCLGHRTR